MDIGVRLSYYAWISKHPVVEASSYQIIVLCMSQYPEIFKVFILRHPHIKASGYVNHAFWYFNIWTSGYQGTILFSPKVQNNSKLNQNYDPLKR